MNKNRICASFCSDFCGMDFDPEVLDEDGLILGQPSSADDNGLCLDDGREDGGCDEWSADEEVCDYCGEPLGFCSSDCETRDPAFEEEP